MSASTGRLRDMGLDLRVSTAGGRTMIGVSDGLCGSGRNGNGSHTCDDAGASVVTQIERLAGVEHVIPLDQPYYFASRQYRQGDTEFEVRGVRIGAQAINVIAGPCTIESREQLQRVASAVRTAGATILRGGTFKARTSPYSFQGMGREGLELLHEAGASLGMPTITEVVDPREVETACRYADILQIGSRNAQNYTLLTEVGRTDRPVLLKRGFAATIDEWLTAAEYVMSRGNHRVILCERGIRAFGDDMRFTLDLSAVPVVRERSHLPVFVDPSHATGKREFVPPMALAAVAAGASGVMIEVHDDPDHALCDGRQAMLPVDFAALMVQIRSVAVALGREVASVSRTDARVVADRNVPGRFNR